jgi:hypothetical protein
MKLTSKVIHQAPIDFHAMVMIFLGKIFTLRLRKYSVIYLYLKLLFKMLLACKDINLAIFLKIILMYHENINIYIYIYTHYKRKLNLIFF